MLDASQFCIFKVQSHASACNQLYQAEYETDSKRVGSRTIITDAVYQEVKMLLVQPSPQRSLRTHEETLWFDYLEHCKQNRLDQYSRKFMKMTNFSSSAQRNTGSVRKPLWTIRARKLN